MARKFRPRKQFRFWLYNDMADDLRLIEFIQFCKDTRQFARVIRNGLRLMWSLGEGDTSVLFELFPGLQAKLIPVDALPKPPDTDKLERQIADLKKIMLEQGTLLSLPPPAEKPSALQKALPLIDADDDDSFAETVVLTPLRKMAAPPTGHGNGDNLLSGIFGVAG